MKIKTIAARYTSDFDAEVNAALAEGWKLKRRDFIPPFEGETSRMSLLFYAELELDADGEEEDKAEAIEHHGCWDCRHYPAEPKKRPCDNCMTAEEQPTEWEAKE